jgi:nucleoid-associated protein YgaU
MFFKGSRYRSVETARTEDDDGRAVQYKRIRFIPDREIQSVHTVREGERLDQISFEQYQVPEEFWRICDANDALWPPELVRDPGRELSIPSS